MPTGTSHFTFINIPKIIIVNAIACADKPVFNRVSRPNKNVENGNRILPIAYEIAVN